MSFINYTTREIHLKVVYFGAGLSGKTTNLQHIYNKTEQDQRGKLVTVGTENERTLFFDFLPLSIGDVRGMKTKFHLYTVPGQTFYELPRQFLLKGVDGIVFVIDSSRERMEANIESQEALTKSLIQQGYSLQNLPIVLQYNKRDVKDAVSVQELEATFNPLRKPYFEAVANQGTGVMETLVTVSQTILQDIKGGIAS